MKTYPAGEIRPHGAYDLLKGTHPNWAYRSHDDSTVFHLMGAQIPRHGQEGVVAKSIKAPIPTWQMLDQQGANQDGVTLNDVVYDPITIDMVVEARGTTPKGARRVIRDWIASWDAKQEGELSCFTHDNGYWWTPVRWLKTPTDQLLGAQKMRQQFTWTARADSAFWRTYDSVETFRFAYNAASETFEFFNANNLGSNWTQAYSGGGTGGNYADGHEARWADGTGTLRVVNRRDGFVTAIDDQVVEIEIGSIPDFTFINGALNSIWCRLNNTGPITDGVGAIFGWGYMQLFRLNGGVATPLTPARVLVIPPILKDRFTLVSGDEGNHRVFKLYRNGFEILSHTEVGTGSSLGAGYRATGFGMQATPGLFPAADSQSTPASVRNWFAGSNTRVRQAGWMRLWNVGDQPAWPRFRLYGPGTFYIANGPENSTEFLTFGPLEAGQSVLLNSEPRLPAVVDLSPNQPAQALDPGQALIKALISFASNNDVPPLLQQFESKFGILPPQANMYSLLNGRFTRPIPPSPTTRVWPSHVAVTIDNGNASSKIVAAVTPQRRWPL